MNGFGKSTGIVLAERPSIGIEPTRLYDASRFENHGTHTNITMVRLPSGLWVGQFNGSSSLVNCGDNTSLDLTSQITILIWIYPTALSGSFRFIAGRDDSNNRNFSLYTSSGDGLAFRPASGGDGKTAIFSQEVLINNNWYLVGGTYDGATTKAWVNGVVGGAVNNWVGAIDNDDVSFTLGAREGGAWDTFGGLMVLSKLCNYALSPGQIKNIYEKQRHWFGV